MEFLTLLIVLGFIQWWGSGGPIQRDDWYEQWSSSATRGISSATVRLAVKVGGPCVLVIVLQGLVDGLLFGLLSLALFVALLLYSLGRGDFSAVIQDYLSSWAEGDTEAAYEKAMSIGDFHQSDAINDSVSLHNQVRKAMVYQGFERWFVVVFWFLVLGPAACLAYRLCYIAARDSDGRDEDKQLALYVVHYLDWLPARLLFASFTLTGNFVNCFNRFWQIGMDNLPIPQLLDSAAEAAISGFDDGGASLAKDDNLFENGKAELLAVQSLLFRSVMCWMMIIALLQMI